MKTRAEQAKVIVRRAFLNGFSQKQILETAEENLQATRGRADDAACLTDKREYDAIWQADRRELANLKKFLAQPQSTIALACWPQGDMSKWTIPIEIYRWLREPTYVLPFEYRDWLQTD